MFFLYLIIVQDLLLIGASAIKLMTNWQEKTKVIYIRKEKAKKY
jgi:hypothetical protein